MSLTGELNWIEISITLEIADCKQYCKNKME